MEGQFEKNGNPYAPQTEYQQNAYTPQPAYSQGNAQPNPYMQQPVYGQEAPQENYKKPMRKAYCRVEWKIFLYAVIAVTAQTLYVREKCLCCGMVYLGHDDYSHVYDCFPDFIFNRR